MFSKKRHTTLQDLREIPISQWETDGCFRCVWTNQLTNDNTKRALHKFRFPAVKRRRPEWASPGRQTCTRNDAYARRDSVTDRSSGASFRWESARYPFDFEAMAKQTGFGDKTMNYFGQLS